MKVLTIKSLLRPRALATVDLSAQHYYCPDPACDTVYFAGSKTYGRADVKVPVYHKDGGGDVPVCYCFGWTRDRLHQNISEMGPGMAIAEIRDHIEAGRCGCEVNNPKGGCCLGDVQGFVALVRSGSR